VNCQSYKPETGRCRKKARVRITLTHFNEPLYRCWRHYIALENTLRQPNTTTRIITADLIK